jgi:glycosyltransferase involved in cell wall biosynthesis
MLSIIIPFHNEKDNLRVLFDELSDALKGIPHEKIFVDDGSTDGSYAEIKNLDCTLITHRRKKGKGAALISGLEKAKGDIIVFMDADLQDDPADLTKFIEKISKGYDMICGWREDRKDSAVMHFISKIGNTVIWRNILSSPFHDINCGYKMFKKEVLEALPLYGDNFRFLALSAHNEGFKVGEVSVNHRPRTHGTSKYTPLKVFFGDRVADGCGGGGERTA